MLILLHFPLRLLSYAHLFHASHLSCGVNILLIDGLLNGGGQILIRRGDLLLLIGGQLFVRRGFIMVAVPHPEEDDSLSNKHTDCASSHTEGDADKNRDESNLDRDPEDMSHAAKEALVVPLVVMMRVRTTILGLEVVVAGELHCAIWVTVGNTNGIVSTLVVMMLVAHHAHDAVEAFDAEALDLVCSGLGGRFNSGNATKKLGHNTAHNIAALSIGSVWGGSDSVDGVEDNLFSSDISFGCAVLGEGTQVVGKNLHSHWSP